MKISKLIIGLVLSLSCFFSYSQTYECNDGATGHIKPVFMNGMQNSEDDAMDSALSMRRKLINIYGKENVKDVFVAYNEDEDWGKDYVEVVSQWLFGVTTPGEYNPDPSFIDNVLLSLKNMIFKVDHDAIKHKFFINEYLEAGDFLFITSHSQGNIYFNALYDNLLKDYLDRFTVVSVGSPVSLNSPPAISKMIIDKNDPITLFNGLKGFNNEESDTNADNGYSDKGVAHSFIGYITGSDTGNIMDTFYFSFVDDINDKRENIHESLKFEFSTFKGYPPLYDDVSFKGAVDISVSESYYTNAVDELPFMVRYKDTSGLELSPIKGHLYRVSEDIEYGDDRYSYTMQSSCDEMPNKMKLSFKAWNHYPTENNKSQINFETDQLDLGPVGINDFLLSYIKPKDGHTLTEDDKKGTDISNLNGLFLPFGYEVTFTRTDYDDKLFNVDLERVYPEYDKTIKVDIKNHVNMGTLYICEIHSRYEGVGGRTFYEYCKLLKGNSSDMYIGRGNIPENQYEYKGNNIAGVILKSNGSYTYTLNHDSYISYNYPGHADNEHLFSRGTLEQVYIRTKALKSKDEEGNSQYLNYRTSVSVDSIWLDLDFSETSSYSKSLYFNVQLDSHSVNNFN